MRLNTEKILVADDDPDIRKILADRLKTFGCEVVLAVDGMDAVEKIVSEEPDLVFLDLQMPKMNGLEVLKKVRGNPDLCVIIITAYGTIQKAVEAMKEGAFDFIPKPFSPDHLNIILQKAFEQKAIRHENEYLKGQVNAPYQEILGESLVMKEAIAIAKKVAKTPSTVLLLGESGTGKEIFARSIHRWSPRSKKPFVVVNCVALRDELLESELFGHEKGAFTGAHALKRGKLEIANGGTVFLDEIGDFKPELQAKLLRVIQEREFERVGGTREIQIDIRVIAATHRDLYKEVQEGRFREDLFFRLNVVTLFLPPLRDRKEDIPHLSQFFCSRACQTLKRSLMKISAEALEHLRAYHWPGNIRELSNIMERAAVLAPGNVVQPHDIPLRATWLCKDSVKPNASYHESVRSFQRDLIARVLQECGGKQSEAAEILQLQRTYLARLIKKLDIS